MDWDSPVDVLVEVSRGGRLKRRGDGRVQYVSPWSSPFNYGCVPRAEPAADGDAQDAVLLGPTEERGARVTGRVVGIVRVIDEGVVDDKWVVVPEGHALERADRDAVEGFFIRYARWKTLFARVRGRRPVTVEGIEWAHPS